MQDINDITAAALRQSLRDADPRKSWVEKVNKFKKIAPKEIKPHMSNSPSIKKCKNRISQQSVTTTRPFLRFFSTEGRNINLNEQSTNRLDPKFE